MTDPFLLGLVIGMLSGAALAFIVVRNLENEQR